MKKTYTLDELDKVYGIKPHNARKWYKYGFPKPKRINLTLGKKGGMCNVFNQIEVQAWIDENKLHLPQPLGLSEHSRFIPQGKVNNPKCLVKVKYNGKDYTIDDVPNYIIIEQKAWVKNKMIYQEAIINRFLLKKQYKREHYKRNADEINLKKRNSPNYKSYNKVMWIKEKAKMKADSEYYNMRYNQNIAWKKDNKERRNKNARERNQWRLDNDPQYYIRSLLHANFTQAFKKQRLNKPWKSSKYGISYKAIGLKLEKDALDMGKTLNQLKGTHHIDHIIPQTFYNLLQPSEVKKCYDARNLRFLPARENCARGCKIRPQDLKIIKTLPREIYPKGFNIEEIA